MRVEGVVHQVDLFMRVETGAVTGRFSPPADTGRHAGEKMFSFSDKFFISPDLQDGTTSGVKKLSGLLRSDWPDGWTLLSASGSGS